MLVGGKENISLWEKKMLMGEKHCWWEENFLWAKNNSLAANTIWQEPVQCRQFPASPVPAISGQCCTSAGNFRPVPPGKFLLAATFYFP